MRKTLLFLTAIITTGSAIAQQNNGSIMFDQDSRIGVNTPVPVSVQPPATRSHSRSNAHTTASSTSRWYNYCDYVADVQGTTLGTTASYIWNDTTSVDAYSGTSPFAFNHLTSIGNVWDPTILGWNDATEYPGLINIKKTDAYSVDSVYVTGIYQRNNNKTTPVDTLTIAVFYGNGATGSDLHTVARDTSGGNSWIYTAYAQDTLFYTRMHYDSINNHADTFSGGFTPIIKQVYLHSTDTSSQLQIAIPVAMNVPAGSMPAISLSFKSGDASFTTGDTVFNANSTTNIYKYGMFRPLVQYIPVGATGASYTTNSKDDQNQGEYMLVEGGRSNAIYYPHWFIVDGSTGGPSTWQYPYFGFHANCPTCEVLGVANVAKNISVVNAFPNPAGNELKVTFSLASATDASVSLTNMMGQIVATQSLGKASTGAVTFNTTALPAGIYFYTILAGGERYVNKVVIAH